MIQAAPATWFGDRSATERAWVLRTGFASEALQDGDVAEVQTVEDAHGHDRGRVERWQLLDRGDEVAAHGGSAGDFAGHQVFQLAPPTDAVHRAHAVHQQHALEVIHLVLDDACREVFEVFLVCLA